MSNFEKLSKFIAVSVANGLYSKNVAHGVGTSLRMYKPYLAAEPSLESFRLNIDRIAQKFMLSNPQLSYGSATTYRSKVLKLIRDYEASENTLSKYKARKKRVSVASQGAKSEGRKSGTQRIELALRPGSPVTLILPLDMTKQEVEVIKSVIDSIRKK